MFHFEKKISNSVDLKESLAMYKKSILYLTHIKLSNVMYYIQLVFSLFFSAFCGGGIMGSKSLRRLNKINEIFS